MTSSKQYVHTMRARTERPRNTKRWYRCECGLWWGINKHFLCTCGRPPPAMVKKGTPP